LAATQSTPQGDQINILLSTQMESPLIFNERVSAISIATTDPAVNSRVVVAGWGRLRVSDPTDPADPADPVDVGKGTGL